MNSTTELLQERAETHGRFEDNARHAQHLKDYWRESEAWAAMPHEHREALDQIAEKFSRILSGQADFAGHWEDVSGYSELARKACRR